MTEVKINDKQVPIQFNNYVLFKFSKALGDNSPNAAIVRLSAMSSADGIVSNDGIEAFCTLLFEMAKMGAKTLEKPLNIKYEDCFDAITDIDTIEAVAKLLMEGMPEKDTIKPTKKKAAAEA